MFDTAQLAALAAVVHHGSFERAARSLHVTPSAVSQRIRALEERVGAVLVQRGTPCVATTAGTPLLRHAECVALLEADLAASLPGLRRARAADAPATATLRVAVNADSLATWLMPALARFAQAAPRVQLDLLLDDQDHTSQALRRGDVLAAVTSLAAPVQGCNSHSLGRLRYRATASPAFVARCFASGVTAQTLAAAPCLVFNRKDRLQALWLQRATRRAVEPPCHFMPSTHAFVDAALAGVGWGMNPQPLAAPHLASGALVELLPGRTIEVPLFWQVSRLGLPALALLTDAVLGAAQSLRGSRDQVEARGNKTHGKR
jgi:LysR family transcriptional regulator, chromosome initiation inhibitor